MSFWSHGLIPSHSLDPYSIQTILGGVSVVGTVPALYLIETWGRRNVRPLLSNRSHDHLSLTAPSPPFGSGSPCSPELSWKLRARSSQASSDTSRWHPRTPPQISSRSGTAKEVTHSSRSPCCTSSRSRYSGVQRHGCTSGRASRCVCVRKPSLSAVRRVRAPFPP